MRAIQGGVTTYFACSIAGQQEVVLDLSDSLAVDSVTHTSGQLPFAHAGDLLSITMPAPMALGEVDSVTVHYHGVPPSTGFGSFEHTKHGPDSTWALWTLSEPYGARDWWPAKHDLNDKADSIDMYVTCPSNYRAGGQGVLVSELNSGGFTTYHWRHRHAVAYYLIALAVAEYAVYSDIVQLNGGPTVEVLNYTFNESLADAQGTTDDIGSQLQLFSDLFGIYPSPMRSTATPSSAGAAAWSTRP